MMPPAGSPTVGLPQRSGSPNGRAPPTVGLAQLSGKWSYRAPVLGTASRTVRFPAPQSDSARRQPSGPPTR
jgi:hypothetical protein